MKKEKKEHLLLTIVRCQHSYCFTDENCCSSRLLPPHRCRERKVGHLGLTLQPYCRSMDSYLGYLGQSGSVKIYRLPDIMPIKLPNATSWFGIMRPCLTILANMADVATLFITLDYQLSYGLFDGTYRVTSFLECSKWLTGWRGHPFLLLQNQASSATIGLFFVARLFHARCCMVCKVICIWIFNISIESLIVQWD